MAAPAEKGWNIVFVHGPKFVAVDNTNICPSALTFPQDSRSHTFSAAAFPPFPLFPRSPSWYVHAQPEALKRAQIVDYKTLPKIPPVLRPAAEDDAEPADEETPAEKDSDESA